MNALVSGIKEFSRRGRRSIFPPKSSKTQTENANGKQNEIV